MVIGGNKKFDGDNFERDRLDWEAGVANVDETLTLGFSVVN
jgi:hypothetical protein